MRHLLAVMAGFVILSVGARQVSAQFEVGHQFGTAYNNQTVVLTQNYYTTNTAVLQCFEIWAVNFTLDGAGHTLRGARLPGGDHVGCKPRDAAPNITIKNLRMTNWGAGIYGPEWCYGLLDSCMVDSNAGYGYQVGHDNNVHTELRNSVFRDNELRAMKLSRVRYFYVHHNEIIHNGYNDRVPETIGGGIDIFTDLSHHNRIEYNLFENNKDYGLSIYGGELGDPKLNLIKGNIFKNNGIIVEQSDSNTFIGNIFDGSASTIRVSGGKGNIFIDCEFEGWTTLDLTVDAGAEVTFIGTDFDGANVSIAGETTELSVGWHVCGIVTIDDVPVDGAVVQFYDTDQLLVAQDTTNAEGLIDTLDLIEYVETIAGKTYDAPYTVVVLQEGTEIYSTSLDLTENTYFTTIPTAIEDRAGTELPGRYALRQNYPNPFNPETMIHFQLAQSSAVTLIIYDLRGEVVRRLVSGNLPAGRHTVMWYGKDDTGVDAASGVYLYTITAGDFQETRRMVLLR